MKEIIHFTDLTLEIWRRPRQRHMNLSVRPDGLVRVTCNKRMAKKQILTFVTESRDFILKRQEERVRLAQQFPMKQVLSGEKWLYLGERVPLQIIWTWTSRIRVEVRSSRPDARDTSTVSIDLRCPLSSRSPERIKALREFYRRSAREHLPVRLEHWCAAMGVKISGLSIRGQTSRWGSCSTHGRISLNWKLMAAPVEVIDYVVIHELAHLKHMNHSRQFWALVEAYDPNWRASKKWLRLNEPELAVQFRK